MKDNTEHIFEELEVVCPFCYSITDIQDDAESFICTVCNRQFRLEDIEYEAHKED